MMFWRKKETIVSLSEQVAGKRARLTEYHRQQAALTSVSGYMLKEMRDIADEIARLEFRIEQMKKTQGAV